MDAAQFDLDFPLANRAAQLESSCMRRELDKAYCAFRAAVDAAKGAKGATTAVVVETGHWGCGAFGGDREVKAAIQLMAAAQARVDKVVYYTLGNEDGFATSLEYVWEKLGRKDEKEEEEEEEKEEEEKKEQEEEVTVSAMLAALEEAREELSSRPSEKGQQLGFRTRFDETPFLFRFLLKKLVK